MKKIGIVTFHQALNYGAKLQAYALQQFLEKNGIENDVIDYTCHFMYTRNIRPIRVGKHHKLKSFIRSLITMRQVGIDRKKSVTFRNEFLNLSRPFDAKNIGEASNEYAAFIAARSRSGAGSVLQGTGRKGNMAVAQQPENGQLFGT